MLLNLVPWGIGKLQSHSVHWIDLMNVPWDETCWGFCIGPDVKTFTPVNREQF